MTKPRIRKGKVNLTDGQYRLLVTAAAQCDYADFHGDSGCHKAAVNHARDALSAIGELTAEQEADQEEDE